MSAAVFAWLRECQDCGKVHNQIPINKSMVSWADPKDGHAYRARLNPHAVDALEEQWNARK